MVKNRISKKVLSLAISSIITTSVFSVSSYAETSDWEAHWAKPYIQNFIDKGYITGYEDGTFRPDNSITRAEFVNIFNKVFKLKKSSGKIFSDTKNHWARKQIDIAVSNGVCNGKSATEFKPNDPITREEAAVMIANFQEIKDIKNDKLDTYNDKDEVSSWAKDSVEGIIEVGYMNGYLDVYSDKTFKPKDKIKRAEAVKTLDLIKINPYDMKYYTTRYELGGCEFAVKDSRGERIGPGQERNIFSDKAENVYQDEQGRIHLKLREENDEWISSEIINTQALGYGKYKFKVIDRPDQIDPNVMLGFFLYKDDENGKKHEIDIEFSKFEDEKTKQIYDSQFVIQPYDNEGNRILFNSGLTGEYTSYIIDYQKDNIKVSAHHGHDFGPVIHEWEYKGEDIPDPNNLLFRANLYLKEGYKPINEKEHEVIISSFEFEK